MRVIRKSRRETEKEKDYGGSHCLLLGHYVIDKHTKDKELKHSALLLYTGIYKCVETRLFVRGNIYIIDTRRLDYG